MRIYLDCCCYNRPFDGISSNNVADEVNAILSIINNAKSKGDAILDSTILRSEINAIKNTMKKGRVQLLLSQTVTDYISYSPSIKELAEKFRNHSATIHYKDSLHLASASIGNADIFITTDYRLIRSCKKLKLTFEVMNPLEYVNEVFNNDAV